MKRTTTMPDTVGGLPLDWDYARTAERRMRFMAPSLSTYVAFDEPLLLAHGEGPYLFDAQGRRYLDCIAQNLCISVGYAHPRVTEAVTAQAAAIQHVTTLYYHPQAAQFAEELVARMPPGADWVVHFVNSGAEAMDLAVLAARAFTGNFEVLALRHAYHGLHFGAMAASGLSTCRQRVPGAPGYVHVHNPDQYRGVYGPGLDPYLEDIRIVISSSTPGAVAGMAIEPIQGYGGVVPMPPGYLRGAAEIVRAAGGLLIVDEVQTGFGRTGGQFWGFQADGILPDIVIMSKGIGNGLPIAATVLRREVAEAMTSRRFFNTYGANPVACAAGRAVLRVIEEEGLQRNAAEVGGRILAGLRSMQARHDIIGDVRGEGLLIGVEIVADSASRKPAEALAARLQEMCRTKGVILGRSGQHRNVLRINPPLCVGPEDAALLDVTFEEALSSI